MICINKLNIQRIFVQFHCERQLNTVVTILTQQWRTGPAGYRKISRWAFGRTNTKQCSVYELRS